MASQRTYHLVFFLNVLKGLFQVVDDLGSLQRFSDEDRFELFLDSSDDQSVDEDRLHALQE